MSELQQRFEQAQKDVVSLAERPQNAVLLKLYAYYKQAVDGDVSGDKPGAFDLVAKKKYAAWEERLKAPAMTLRCNCILMKYRIY